MFDQYLNQLASTDSSQRRQAIIGLGKSGDERALPPLANVYKNDPDPSLRDLALKAGRYLKGLTASVPSSEPYSSMTEATAVEPAGEAVKTELPQKEISYTARQKAKGRVDYAIGLVAEGRNDKALDELVDAIRINPELVDDQVVQNLASNVTGKYSTDEAMSLLVEKAQETSKPKRKAPAAAEDSGTADNGSIILLITILILFILTAIMTIITRLGLLNEFQLMKSVSTLSRQQATNFDQASASLTTLTSSSLVIGGILETVGTLIYTGVLFGVGKIFGGTGGAVRVINRLLRVQVIMYFPIFAIFGYFFFYEFNNLTASHAVGAPVADAVAGVGLCFLLAYFVEFVWEGIALAKAHDFSVVRGCLSVIVGVIVLMVLAVMLTIGLSILLAPALAQR